MSVNKIVVNGKEFSDATRLNNDPGMSLYSCNLFISNSLSCDELSVDTLNTQINCSEYAYTYFRPKDSSCLVTQDKQLFCVRPRITILAENPLLYAYGQKVQYYRDNVLIATLYMSSVKRVNKYMFAISCASPIGLLDNEPHYGGIYTGQTADSVLRDIIGGLVPVTIDSVISNMHVYGWLPVATRRENLQQVLFAEGGVLQNAPDGSIKITALQKTNIKNLPDSRLFSGGSVEYPGGVTAVSITEHTYTAFPGDKDKNIFDGNLSIEPITTPKGAAIQGMLITFNEPIHDLQASGAIILESGANYAVLGNGISCVLTGKPYTHSTRIITRPDKQTGRAMVNITDNTAIVDKATLVSLMNAENVAERVYRYCHAARTINTDMLLDSERPGSYVSLTDPFDDAANGFIQSLDINVSQTLKARANIVANYDPPIPGDYYSNVTVLTSNRTWTVPASCKGKIRVIIGGGGQGGSSGYSGSRGEVVNKIEGSAGSYFVPGSAEGFGLGIGGEGGAGGNGGAGGKIAQFILSVTPGQSFYVSIGAGGRGGRGGENTPGALGGDTTFGSYSSATGEISSVGYVEQIQQVRYSTPGLVGIAGGRGAGGIGKTVDWNNCSNISDGNSIIDEDGVTWTCGNTERYAPDRSQIARESGRVIADEDGDLESGYVDAVVSYALGSGAAAGSKGVSPTYKGTYEAYKKSNGKKYSLFVIASGVSGTNGANATKIPKKQTIRGAGGRGGYGGGGAGGHGMALTVAVSGYGASSVSEKQSGGVLGYGGSGGQGGDGGDGYVIIYW